MYKHHNICRKLFGREIFGHRPGAEVNHIRGFYDSLTPNSNALQLDLPEAHISRFSPDGQYLVGFGSAFQELVVYRVRGLSQALNSEDSAASASHSDTIHTSSSASTTNQTITFDSFFELLYRAPILSQVGSILCKDFALFPPCPPTSTAADFVQSSSAASNVGAGALVQNNVGLGGNLSSSAACNAHIIPTPTLVLLASQTAAATPAESVPRPHLGVSADGAGGNGVSGIGNAATAATATATAAWPELAALPKVACTTLHLVRLEDGVVLDTMSWEDDWVPLSTLCCVSMWGDLLAVTAVRSQTIHLVSVVRGCRLVRVGAVGAECAPDDYLVVRAAQEAEERWLLHQSQVHPKSWRGEEPQTALGSQTGVYLAAASDQGGSAPYHQGMNHSTEQEGPHPGLGGGSPRTLTPSHPHPHHHAQHVRGIPFRAPPGPEISTHRKRVSSLSGPQPPPAPPLRRMRDEGAGGSGVGRSQQGSGGWRGSMVFLGPGQDARTPRDQAGLPSAGPGAQQQMGGVGDGQGYGQGLGLGSLLQHRQAVQGRQPSRLPQGSDADGPHPPLALGPGSMGVLPGAGVGQQPLRPARLALRSGGRHGGSGTGGRGGVGSLLHQHQHQHQHTLGRQGSSDSVLAPTGAAANTHFPAVAAGSRGTHTPNAAPALIPSAAGARSNSTGALSSSTSTNASGASVAATATTAAAEGPEFNPQSGELGTSGLVTGLRQRLMVYAYRAAVAAGQAAASGADTGSSSLTRATYDTRGRAASVPAADPFSTSSAHKGAAAVNWMEAMCGESYEGPTPVSNLQATRRAEAERQYGGVTDSGGAATAAGTSGKGVGVGCSVGGSSSGGSKRRVRQVAKQHCLRVFYAHFEALTHLVVWRAQLVSRDLLLLDLGSFTPPASTPNQGGIGNEGAVGGTPLNQQPTPGGRGSSQQAQAQATPHQTLYLALYDWKAAKVEAFVSTTSNACIALLSRFADDLSCDSGWAGAGAAGFGAGANEWVRFASGPASAHVRAARELLASAGGSGDAQGAGGGGGEGLGGAHPSVPSWPHQRAMAAAPSLQAAHQLPGATAGGGATPAIGTTPDVGHSSFPAGDGGAAFPHMYHFPEPLAAPQPHPHPPSSLQQSQRNQSSAVGVANGFRGPQKAAVASHVAPLAPMPHPDLAAAQPLAPGGSTGSEHEHLARAGSLTLPREVTPREAGCFGSQGQDLGLEQGQGLGQVHMHTVAASGSLLHLPCHPHHNQGACAVDFERGGACGGLNMGRDKGGAVVRGPCKKSAEAWSSLFGAPVGNDPQRYTLVRRVLAMLPGSSQLLSASPLLDTRLFAYDTAKLAPLLPRPRPLGEQPPRFYPLAAPHSSPMRLEFGSWEATTNARSRRAARLLLFHPTLPLVLCVGSQVMGPQVVCSLHYKS